MRLPTALSYERSVSPSPALMYAVTFDGERVPILVKTFRGRGAISDHSAGHGEKDADLGEWMPVRQDVSTLPHNANTLEIEFSVKYLPQSLSPICCNEKQFSDKLKELASLYKEKDGYIYQAYCQMDSLFLGLPFWRNNDSEEMALTITNISDSILPPFRFCGLPCTVDTLSSTSKLQLQRLTENIASALCGNRSVLRLKIIVSMRKDILEEVYPSQVFTEKLSSSKKEYLHRKKLFRKSREYACYELEGLNQAMIHSTKINAGLRIDRWNDCGKIISVSAYGLDPMSKQALRGRGTKNDIYSILSKIDNHIKVLGSFDGDIFSHKNVDLLTDVHFLMANLIKGGLFSRESSKIKGNN